MMQEMDTANKEHPAHRLVFGLGDALMYSLRSEDRLRKMFECFTNDFLVSTTDLTFKRAEFIRDLNIQDRTYLDSGGFTLFKEQFKHGADSEIFVKRCEKFKKKFLKLCEILKPKECFELDNDYFLHNEDLTSPENFLRQEVFDILGYYPTPVFKLHQGVDYWMKLCEDPRYPRLSIGGLAQTREWHKNTELLKTMMDYARAHNKKVHLLGCQNVQAFKEIQPDTVDYSIYQFAISVENAKAELCEARQIPVTERKGYKVALSEIYEHTVLYALARAKARSFLYDAFAKPADSDD